MLTRSDLDHEVARHPERHCHDLQPCPLRLLGKLLLPVGLYGSARQTLAPCMGTARPVDTNAGSTLGTPQYDGSATKTERDATLATPTAVTRSAGSPARTRRSRSAAAAALPVASRVAVPTIITGP